MANSNVNEDQGSIDLPRAQHLESALSLLLSKAEAKMTKGEYLSVAESAERIMDNHAFNMAETVLGIACLVHSDEEVGSFKTKEDVAHLLYGIAENFRYLNALGTLASEARAYARSK